MIVLTGALAVGLAFVLLVAGRSYLNQRSDYVRTAPSAISAHPEQTHINALAEVSVQPAGAARLAGWYAPPGESRAAVILVHGVGADRSSLLFETKTLAAAGFGVLALDLPGQGASGGKTEWGRPERRAIREAVDWLRTRPEVDPNRIGAFGLSMGAYVLAQAAVLDPRIAAVVLASTPNDVVEFNWIATAKWGWLSQYPTYWATLAAGTPLDMAPKDILGKLSPRPLMLVQGEHDSLVLPWMAQQLYAAAREPKALYVVPGAEHANFSQVAATEYARRLTEFYRRWLTPAGS